MTFDFPVESVKIAISEDDKRNFNNCLLCRPHLKVNNNALWLDVWNVASYYATNGDQITITPHLNSDLDSIKLFLYGSALGAILHQRGIIPFHGSAFSINDKGILLCGFSGAGKSSLTASFCQNGAKFISDDITPVSMNDSTAQIAPLKTSMKLWDDSIKKLNIKNDNLKKIRPVLDKYYVPYPVNHKKYRLDHLIILGVHNQLDFQAQEINNLEKYNALRGQIYRKMYLKGMPETEKLYFKQLLQIASTIKVTQVLRPKICEIHETVNFIKKVANL